MKVTVTISGTLNLRAGDVKILQDVSVNEVIDTLRTNSKDMMVVIDKPPAAVKAKVVELLEVASDGTHV